MRSRICAVSTSRDFTRDGRVCCRDRHQFIFRGICCSRSQYDAASAYIKSQAHAGWTLIRSRYDDSGYSGGSTDRPDLQRLLDDIRSRKIDVIVVYKVDRLTRSLADFAKLVELFDAHGVSFVSVTQQFNTTTSMGRLTLNVLLSFAQFEREVTSERIRDKIAASKRKGLWVGGPLPLGYQMKDDKIAVVENEAERVRLIFRRYLELGGVNALVRDLRERNIRTKTRPLATGVTRGGIPFGRGSLFYLLRNRFYIGEVKYKNEIPPGEQPAIMDRALFDAVQQKLTEQWTTRSTTRNASAHLLTGLLFDDAGHRMVPTHATKAGIRYRYYVSLPHLYGESKTASVGSVSRIPAPEIERIVVKSINEHLIARKERPSSGATNVGDRKLIIERGARIDVHEDRLVIRIKSGGGEEASDTADENLISIPWQKPPSRKSWQILVPHGVPRSERPPNADRTPRAPRSRNRPRSSLARRDRVGRRDRRSADRGTSKMQPASGQYDHLACLPRAGPRYRSSRRPATTRHRGRTTTRCSPGMEPAVRSPRT
jgi:DNA invertase Pin-like site-specific DNA recombinase